LKNYVTVF